MKLGYHSITWGGVVGDASGVTSVKDLFYRAAGSMTTAVEQIGAAGYAGTEMFDGNLASFEGRRTELRDALDAAGVELVSVYTGANFIYAEALPDELHRITRAAELARAFGADRLVVGGGARRAAGTTSEDYRRLGAALDEVTAIADRFGLAASYHPHLSTIVETPRELERIMEVSSIPLCPDTAHLAAGGGDPAAIIREYGDRVRQVHLKDFRPQPSTFLPLGAGELDFPDILSALREVGYDDWLMVELDYFDGDPAEAARISRTYLEGLLGA